MTLKKFELYFWETHPGYHAADRYGWSPSEKLPNLSSIRIPAVLSLILSTFAPAGQIDDRTAQRITL
jgi:hypothetical protein